MGEESGEDEEVYVESSYLVDGGNAAVQPALVGWGSALGFSFWSMFLVV